MIVVAIVPEGTVKSTRFKVLLAPIDYAKNAPRALFCSYSRESRKDVAVV